MMKLSSKDRVLVKKARDIMFEHKGEKNAVSARNVSLALGIKEGDTFIRTRSIIDKVVRMYRLPIAATTNSGYFLITNAPELYKYMGSLEGRKMQIEDKKQVVFKNFIEYYGGLDVQEEVD